MMMVTAGPSNSLHGVTRQSRNSGIGLWTDALSSTLARSKSRSFRNAGATSGDATSAAEGASSKGWIKPRSSCDPCICPSTPPPNSQTYNVERRVQPVRSLCSHRNFWNSVACYQMTVINYRRMGGIYDWWSSLRVGHTRPGDVAAMSEMNVNHSDTARYCGTGHVIEHITATHHALFRQG